MIQYSKCNNIFMKYQKCKPDLNYVIIKNRDYIVRKQIKKQFKLVIKEVMPMNINWIYVF